MNTIWLSATGLFGSTLLGALLGFFFKELPHKWNDTVLGYCSGIMLAASTLGLIVPAFEQGGTPHWWLIVVGVMGGALFLNVLDLVTPHLHHLTGLDPEQHSHNSNLNRIMLFVLAIALPKIAMTAKMLRSSVVQELRKDYVRTALSRGRKFSSVLFVHVLRNALIPVVTFLAMTIADIAAGSIIIEQVFSIPGIGRLLLASILNRDFPVVLAIVVMLAFLVVFVNFLVDVLYQFIDPRIKVS